jgi:adenosylcobinamide-GDP ribazoletransferase
MRRAWLDFLFALRFLTVARLPWLRWESDRLRAATLWFPLVGALVGLLGFAVLWGSASVLPAAAAAGLALAAMVWATGALHEDGLSDVADGFGAHVSRERALEIMRDSRIGAFGAVALVLSLGLRWSALAALAAAAEPVALAAALAGAAAAGRAGMLVAARMLAPARPGGLGAALGPGPGAGALAGGLATAAAIALAAGPAGLGALAAAALAAGGVIRIARRRIGGHTGDVLGAVSVAAETAALLAFAGALAGGAR